MATPSEQSVPPTTSTSDPINTQKAVIKNVDMAEEMQVGILQLAGLALEQFQVEKDIAAHVKRECDKRYGPTWHVVAGRNFGSYVTHGTLRAL